MTKHWKLIFPVIVLALIGSLMASPAHAMPDRKPLTLFSCAPEYVVGGQAVTYHYQLCAEHLGSGFYRTNAVAWVVSNATGQKQNANFAFYYLNLYYYCYTGPCTQYDSVHRTGYINTSTAVATGTNVGCPGASNLGELSQLELDVRVPPSNPNLTILGIPAANEPDHVQFNSAC